MRVESDLEETGAGPAEPGALAFATDAESEQALRDGLAGYREAQVWPGGLHAAAAALAGGAGARLLFVDLDGVGYPAGAIHELAAVCEVGTVVVAFGTDASARFSREVLLAGVSDYLVKPLRAAPVREAAERAGLGHEHSAEGGSVAAFAGSGGSGTTTLAAAVALGAAERGRYVSVLDLARPFAALAFVLDVEPAAGLEQLLDSAGRGAPDADTVDAVSARREERIAVYAYRFGPTPPPPPAPEAVLRVVEALERRSHLVVVDGLEGAEMRAALLGRAERRVVVVEPTPGGARRAVRLLAHLGKGPAPVVVRNHTRAFDNAQSIRALRRAGLKVRPRVSVPFEPTVPALCDRGWPRGQVPRALHGPLSALTALLLRAPGAASSPPRERGADTAPRRGSSRFAWWPRGARARPA